MRATAIQLWNFRSFVDSGLIPLGRMNVLIGANNAGKTSILRGLYLIQQGSPDIFGDVRVGANEAKVQIHFEQLEAPFPQWGIGPGRGPATFHGRLQSGDRRGGTFSCEVVWDGRSFGGGDSRLPPSEPAHVIVPFLSKRKTAGYSEDIREQFVTQVPVDMGNLAAKLSRLANPNFPGYEAYSAACRDILGFVVTSIPSPNGQRPGVYLPDQSTVPIDQMGDGVPNIVFLLAQLAVSRNKIFLIEEPENDIHPRALKALLALIVASAEHNQFIISTHSNIVVTHLCAVSDSRLYKISSPLGQLPATARAELVPATPDARIAVLGELGYTFSDFSLWDGWLILEESSAERIIRDYLIPWYAPALRSVRTYSANGISSVEASFADLFRLIVFTHLQPAYTGRIWVQVDGGKVGEDAVQNLRKKFPSIEPSHFQSFDKTDFELYYPHPFADRVTTALAIQDKQAKRQAKRELLDEVRHWLDQDETRAKTSLEASAAPVIDTLQRIEAQFKAAVLA